MNNLRRFLFIYVFLHYCVISAAPLPVLMQKLTIFDSVQFKYMASEVLYNSNDKGQLIKKDPIYSKYFGEVRFLIKDLSFYEKYDKYTPNDEGIFCLERTFSRSRIGEIEAYLTQISGNEIVYESDQSKIKFQRYSEYDYSVGSISNNMYLFFPKVSAIFWEADINANKFVLYSNFLKALKNPVEIENITLEDKEYITIENSGLYFDPKSFYLKMLLWHSDKDNKKPFLKVIFDEYDSKTIPSKNIPKSVKVFHYNNDGEVFNIIEYNIDVKSLAFNKSTKPMMQIVFPIGSSINDQTKSKKYIVTESTDGNAVEDVMSDILEDSINEANNQKNTFTE